MTGGGNEIETVMLGKNFHRMTKGDKGISQFILSSGMQSCLKVDLLTLREDFYAVCGSEI